MDKLKRNYSLIASPLIVMSLILAVFYKGGLYPFGSNSAAWCDMYQQVIPLLTDFKDILSGKQSIFFNLGNAGGMNFWGVFFFFIASPFSLLVVFFDKTHIIDLCNLLIIIKLSLSAFTSALYLKKHFTDLSQMFVVILSISYGLCGYGMLYFQNNIWLDEMYLFPLLLLGFDLLKEKRKIVPFTAVLAAIVIVNYYISYMVIVFLLMLMGFFCYRYKKDDKYRFVAFDLIISCIFAALSSAVVWLPCFWQYLSSGRTTSIIHELSSCNFLSGYQTTLSTLLPSSFLILTVLICAFDSKPRSKELNTHLILLFLTFIPLIIEPVNKMWHTGSYMSFPSRYGFITIYMLVLCCAGFFSSDSKNIAPPKKKADSKITLLICAVVIYCFYMFFSGFVSNNYETISVFTKTLWQNNDSFMLLFELFFASVLLQSIVFFLFKRGWISRSIFPVFACVFILIEGYANVDIYMNSATVHNPTRAERLSAAMQLSDRIEDDSTFWRMNTAKKYFDVNDVGAMGYNSLGHYTSLTAQDYMFMMKELGYSSYWMEVAPYGGTELTDALMNVKYRIVTGQKDSVYTTGMYSVIENDYYLPLGLVTTGDLSGTDLEKNTRAQNQQLLFEKMFDTDEQLITEYTYRSVSRVITPKEHKNKYAFERLENTNETFFTYSIDVEGEQTLYFDCFNELSNKLSEPINGSFDIYVNDRLVTAKYPAKDNNGVVKLGSFKDENVKIKAIIHHDLDVKSFGVFGLDTALLREKLDNAVTVNIKEDGSSLKGSIDAEKGQKCILSIPNNDGLKVTVNGKEVQTQSVFGDLVSFELNDGKNDIEVSLTPRGFVAGLVISIIGIALTVFYALKIKKYDAAKELTAVSRVLIILAGLAALIVIYIVPCIINMYFEE